jgi:hypothetical protein
MNRHTLRYLGALIALLCLCGCRNDGKDSEVVSVDLEPRSLPQAASGSVALTKPYEYGRTKIWADRSEQNNGGESVRFSGHVRILISNFQLIDAFEDPNSSVTIDIKTGVIIEKRGAFHSSEILGVVPKHP